LNSQFSLQNEALPGRTNTSSKPQNIHQTFTFPMIDDPMNCC